MKWLIYLFLGICLTYSVTASVIVGSTTGSPWSSQGRNICEDNQSNLFATFINNTYYIVTMKSADNGTTWTKISEMYRGYTGFSPFLACSGSNIAYGTADSALQLLFINASTDNGNTWSLFNWTADCSADYVAGELLGNRLYLTCKGTGPDGNTSGGVHVGLINGTSLYRNEDVLWSNGKSMNRQSISATGNGSSTDKIVVTATDTNALDLIYSYSYDGGQTWTKNGTYATTIYMGNVLLHKDRVYVPYYTSTTVGDFKMLNTQFGSDWWRDETAVSRENGTISAISLSVDKYDQLCAIYSHYNRTGTETREIFQRCYDGLGWYTYNSTNITTDGISSYLTTTFRKASQRDVMHYLYRDYSTGNIRYNYLQVQKPVFNYSNMQLVGNYTDYAPANSIEGARGMQYDTRSVMWIASTTDDSLTGLYVFNPRNITAYTGVNDASPPGSVDNIWFFNFDNVNKIAYTPSFTDDVIDMWNLTGSVTHHNGSAAAISANSGAVNGSLDQVYDNAYLTRNNETYCIASASVDDTVSVYNCTGDYFPRPTGFRNVASGSCTTDDIRQLYAIPGTNIILGASTTDSTLVAWNLTATGNLTCLQGYANAGPTYSIWSLQGFYYEAETQLVYIAAPNADGLTILNASPVIQNTGNFTAVGYVTNSAKMNASIVVTAHKIGTERFAFMGSNGIWANDFGIDVLNVTNPTSPVHLGNFTTPIGNCKFNQTYSLFAIQNYLFATSGGTTIDSCFYSIKLFDNNVTKYIPPYIPDISVCTYSGTGTWIINNTYCYINSNITIQSGYDWYIQNSTVFQNKTWVKGYRWAHWLSGWLHII